MNMLSAMLWAWVGVSVLSLVAAAGVVLVELSLQEQPARPGEQLASYVLPQDGPQDASEHPGAHDLSSCEPGVGHAAK